MTKHEIIINESDGRWYPKCRCGWDMLVALRDGDATPNKGHFGRATEAEASALADTHLARHQEKPVTRRMQANIEYGGVDHAVEHDEIDSCRFGIPCTPVADTVAVPATGSHLIIDGEVHEVEDVQAVDEWQFGSPRRTYSMRVKPPKPFFEEGKTYRHRRNDGGGMLFEAVTVRDNVAFGRQYPYGDVTRAEWVTKRFFGGWEEVTE